MDNPYLRHTHTTNLLEAGEHPKFVQERLVHGNIGTLLDIYSHVNINMQTDMVKRMNQWYNISRHKNRKR